MEPNTILCDIDGVLIWHHPTDPMQDWRRLIKSHTALELWEDFQRSTLWELCLRNTQMDTRESYYRYLVLQNQEHDENAREAIDIWLHYNLLPSAPALKKLKQWKREGYQCALATNQDTLRMPFIEEWCAQNGIDTLRKFVSCEMNAAKPDREFYEHIERELGKEPEELILLDDSFKNIEGAWKAGWYAYHIHDEFRFDPPLWSDYNLSGHKEPPYAQKSWISSQSAKRQ